MLMSIAEVQFNLRHKILLTSFDLVLYVLRSNTHEFVAEGVFECKHASFYELERVDELALESKEFGKI